MCSPYRLAANGLLLLACALAAACSLRAGPSRSAGNEPLPNPELAAVFSKLLHAAAVAEGEEPNNVEGAINALAALGEPAMPQLKDALRDPDENVRLAAVHALAKLNTPAVVEPLLIALNDESSDIRTEAVRALGELRDRRAVQPLLQQARTDDTHSVRYDSLASLGKIGDPAAAPLLLSGIHDGDRYVRMWSMSALCEMHHEQAPELALLLLGDPDLYVRRHVLAGCADALDTPAGHDALIALALGDDLHSSLLARRNLATYLERRQSALAERNDLGERMRRAGHAGLRNSNQAVKAALLLSDVHDPAAIAPLARALHEDQNEYVRALAARQLAEIGDARAVADLIQALADRSELVRTVSSACLQRFAQTGDAAARAAVENLSPQRHK